MYVLKGRNIETLATVYYTGRAGNLWTSDKKAEAFLYASYEGAKRKVYRFNRTTRLHKILWMVDYQNESDAHNAGAAAMSDEMCG